MKINDRFEIRPDRYCWILVEHIENDPSRKNTKRESREYHTYHGNVEQACREVLSRTGGECDTAAERWCGNGGNPSQRYLRLSQKGLRHDRPHPIQRRERVSAV